MNGRSSGILLPVFSLPGRYGIGSLGQEARNFVDFLASAGQHYWQILPLVPPGDGDSPYMSPSTFAGNPFLIDLDTLHEDGLLTEEELEGAQWADPDRVDYAMLHETRIPLLRKAFQRDKGKSLTETEALRQEAPWLDGYARFAALREQLDAPVSRWPAPVPEPDGERVAFHLFLQTVFFRQWKALRTYANDRGVSIIGDLPFYVSDDSADFYAQPELFQIDETGRPAAVAGVPPDAFSATGQHWGNPLYDWEGRKEDVFAWWGRRMAWCAKLYDVVRIDHFRAFHTYWSIPAGEDLAVNGTWKSGPGMELLDLFREEAPGLAIIAEDLGDLDAAALAFIQGSGLPGMKVLVHAFDPDGESAYLPHNCPPDAVVYTGTHDTPTFVQWFFDQADERARAFAADYLRLRSDEGYGWGVVSAAWATASRLSIAPLQDVLGLGADARMNTPGTSGSHNWSWRVRREALNADVAGRLFRITRTYRRG